ncbi:hypothetical protein AB0M28_37555 [Streptomyces sp. NPDC051940]|uniref:hypothetical protein n=1 Tax=Streptomyces sp. NPDC051940 TaxID=3155675 RepID=UPI0034484669
MSRAGVLERTAGAEGTAAARGAGPFRTELRRGTGPLSALLIFLSVTLAMAGKATDSRAGTDWPSSWSQTAGLLGTLVLLSAPLATAAGAWQGAREHRTRLTELLASTPRGLLRRSLPAWVSAALWPALGYLAAAAVCHAYALLYVSYGRPLLASAVAHATLTAAFGTLGFALGRAVPRAFTAPVSAVAAYVLLGATAYTDGPLARLSPVDGRTSAGHTLAWWQPPAEMLLAAGVGGAALVVAVASLRHKPLAVVPLLLAVVGGGLLTQGGDPWRSDPGATALVCDRKAPRLCLTAVHGGLLDDASRRLDPLRAKLSGVPGLPERLVEAPGRRRAEGDRALPPADMYSARNRIDDGEFFVRNAWSAMGLVRHGCRFGPRARLLNSAVDAWVMEFDDRRIGFFADEEEVRRTRAVIDRIDALSPAGREAWLTAYFTAARECAVDTVELP